ncbi:TonB-dependent receptor [Lacibacter sp.]|uniref:TonB-dependent receptor plug domain-containing protein n=1 Tax=Lacibacter sp. TaxID=1915409 RepID=UPI002B4AFA3C|nr:TonB-dependent receptor [Lacibacter sp.]HLP36046.1 TonB-dependent receptor [Lacibacter sp.]
MKMRILFALLFFSSLKMVVAQTDSSETKELGEVFVTAQRSNQQVLKIPYAVKRIGKDQLQQFVPRTTPEALQGMNGVFIQKTNHGGGSAFVRGLTGNQTLLLMDGIRLNNSTYRYGPNQYLNTIDPFLIDRIEVAKGTGSVQYGTDALGGVIQLFSKEPVFTTGKAKLSGNGLIKYMSGNMEKTARASLTYSTERIAFTGGITLRDFGDLIGGDTTGKQTPSGYDEWSLNAKVKFLVTKTMQLTLSHQQLQQTHIPLYHRVKLENFALSEFDLQKHQLQYVKFEANTNQKWADKFTLIGSHQQTNEGRTSRRNGSNMLRNENDDVQTIGLTLDINSRFSKFWTANSGVEMYIDKVKSKTVDTDVQANTSVQKRGLYPNDATYGNYSLYSLHHFNFQRWFIDAGIRFNTFSINLQDSSVGKVNITPSAMVYNAAVNYAVSRNHHVYVGYSTGYRAPNIDDMGTLGIVDFRYELPTSNLNPEKSGNLETGYKFNSKKLKGDVAVYYMHLNDLITRVREDGTIINGYQVYRKENTEKAFIAGAEAELTWMPVNGLQLNGNISYNYGHNKTKNEPLRRIPPVNGRFISSYKKNQWFASVEWLYASKQTRLAQGDKDDNRIPKGGTPGWNVLNIYAGYEWKQLRFNTGIQNLFNEDYRTHGSGINGVGRSVWVSVAVEM